MDKKCHMSSEKGGPLQSMTDRISVSEEDIYAAMKEIPGYLDITVNDFKELYELSFHHALKRLICSVRAGDIMSREVVSVTATTPLQEVAARMAEASVSGVPVLAEDGKIVGIISERDFLKHMGAANASFMSIVAACLLGKGCAAVTVRKGVASDIMTRPAITVRADAFLSEVATILSKNNINRLPVLAGAGDTVVGFLTRSDLVGAHIFE